MKRYLAFILMTAMLLTSLAIVPASAAQPGEAIGNVLYSDVVAYIDGYPIRSYNINGYTYIIAEDLAAYGFHVEWRGDEGKLIIHTARTANPSNYTANYMPEKNTHIVGSVAFPYLHTNITTWIGQNQVTGYNVGGSTCICMDDLAKYFGTSYVWNPEDVTLRLVTTSSQTPTASVPTMAPSTSSTDVFHRLKNYALNYGVLSSSGDRYLTTLATHYSSDYSKKYMVMLGYDLQNDEIVLAFYDTDEVTFILFLPNNMETPYRWYLSEGITDYYMLGNMYPSLWRTGGTLTYSDTDVPYSIRSTYRDLAGSSLSILLLLIDKNSKSLVTLDELGFINFP